MARTLFDPHAIHSVDPQPTSELLPIEAVLFDFSNTLFHMIDDDRWLRRVGHAAGLGDALVTAGVSDQLVKAYATEEVMALQEGRDLSPERHRAAMFGWFRQVDLLRGIEEVAYAEMVAPDAWVPYPDTEPTLRALGERGIRVGIVSDFAWDLRVHLTHHGLNDLVAGCVMSYQVGFEKPDPRIFRIACDSLGCAPSRTLMVGDNPARDGGATAVGLRAFLLSQQPVTGERGLADVLRLIG